jgi:predicted nuclease with TOPRIM domain
MDKSVLLCDERHKRLDEKIAIHERRLNNHSERLDRIELANGRLEERLNNLITQLENLNKTMKWFMGLLVGSFVAFFFYAVQQGLFR